MEEEPDQAIDPSPNDAEERQQQTNLNKACEACRGSKLRCIIDPTSSDGSCKRCVATGRTCVYKAPRVRQRRKVHVDVRVAELERQLRSLRMQLHQAQHGLASSPPAANPGPPVTSTLRFEAPVTPASWPKKATAASDDLIPNDRVHRSPPDTPDEEIVQSINAPCDDVVQRQILTWENADRLVHVYLTDFATHYPFVCLPCFTDTETFRRNRPATFLAVVAAASGTSSPKLNKILCHELLALLAKRIMLEGEHNLDIIQAMIIMTIWYTPMEKFESLRQYQFAHLAATIAMDIGLGDESAAADNENISDDLDRRRTLLSIYMLCTGISVQTGRPKMLRFTNYMQRCIDRLKSQDSISHQDQWFLAWVELQRLTETAADVFFTTPTDISLPANQQAVAEFCHKLDEWRHDLPINLEGALEIHYHYVRSMVLCVCLYVDHDLADFRPPFRVRALNRQAAPSAPMTPFLARTTIALVETVHSAIDAFLSFSSIELLAAPMIYYIRTLHPLSILLMLDIACRRPENEMAKIIDQDTLRVGEYFHALQRMLSPYESETQRTPAKFLAIIKRMETWWQSQSEQSSDHARDLRPFAKLTVPNEQHTSPATTENSTSPVESFNDIDSSHFAGRMPMGAANNLRTDAQTSSFDESSLFMDNWVFDMDQDPASLLMPEIDWSLFESPVLLNANG
ncbi:hypothetical protein M409DRAFT_28941 [Zasmidium cellare ATCC 36951]|uniref:Zn(2)-C6 fungal-type domain-containing protein n=1 Tax=Zasmidium cellare ATCC 36951 TaxID=1080233 RepID=A0A6A6C0I3_ZASCE|nr:uncharacterized protein M409DRAFT_28941 [Zasmidium cellare ATCC 36951]KAF2160557.1 hypothetical protein M409DRAFT_28941 [Zasmidium cellare ATCC 36951]